MAPSPFFGKPAGSVANRRFGRIFAASAGEGPERIAVDATPLKRRRFAGSCAVGKPLRRFHAPAALAARSSSHPVWCLSDVIVLQGIEWDVLVRARSDECARAI
jgi:hypothetical protein